MYRKVLFIIVCLLFPTGVLAQFGLFESKASGKDEGARASEETQSTRSVAGSGIQVGRFQLITTSDIPPSMFLIDTATGCVWTHVANAENKRMTFVEVDVENLHWSYGSGAQQLLAERIDASNLTPEQKKALKEELRKTGCGLSSNLVLTPGRVKAEQE